MNVDTWIAVVTLGLILIGVIVRNERRQGKYLTREEHDKICADRNTRAEKSLDELRGDMERRHDENRETLGRIDAATTGTHKRIDQLYLEFNRRRGASGE